MWLVIGQGLKKVLGNPRVLLGVGLAAMLGLGAWQWNNMQDTLMEQRITISQQASTIETKDVELRSARNARIAVEARLVQEAETNRQLSEIRGEINATPEEQDGPLAPVIEHTLSGLIRMRDNSTSTSSGDAGNP